jgi:hypothetical protein
MKPRMGGRVAKPFREDYSTLSGVFRRCFRVLGTRAEALVSTLLISSGMDASSLRWIDVS